MNNTTYSVKKSEIESKWYIIDAENKILGRVATEILWKKVDILLSNNMWIGLSYDRLLFIIKHMEVFFIKQELLVNEQIRFSEVQVISDDGQKLGVMKTSAALDLASSKDLDLVLVAPNNKPAVCKIMNYGKYKFEQAKKEKDAKPVIRQANPHIIR